MGLLSTTLPTELVGVGECGQEEASVPGLWGEGPWVNRE